MIISLFGPDGVGKSTVAAKLSDKDTFVFSGTAVAKWPDLTWHNELVANGIDETLYDNDKHFLEKISRCHRVAEELFKKYKDVVIDSDPFHKTWLYDFVKNKPDRFKQLYDLAYKKTTLRMHICVLLGEQDDDAAAKSLQSRIANRGGHEYFDPRTIEDSKKMILASRELCEKLKNMGEKVYIISPDYAGKLQGLLS